MSNVVYGSSKHESEILAEYPLSHGQRGLWFLQHLNPRTAAYNIVRSARLREPVDVTLWQQVYQDLINSTPALRTTFALRNGQPVQRIHKTLPVNLHHENAVSWSEAELEARLVEEAFRPFNLEQESLLRITIFTRSERETIKVWSLHHIITDLWSLAIMLRDAFTRYQEYTQAATPMVLERAVGEPLDTLSLTASAVNETTKAPPASSTRRIATPYVEHVQTEAEMLAGPEGQRLKTYWLSQLSGELPVLNLPTDHPRPAQSTCRGATRSMRIDTPLTQRLKEVSAAHHTTLYTTLLAAFQVLLYRYSGQEDILVGSPRANRTRNFALTAGYFVNLVVLRGNLAGNPSFATFLAHMHETAREGFAHGTYPFSLLVEQLQPSRDVSRHPLIQAAFSWQKTTSMINKRDIAPLALGEAQQTVDIEGISLNLTELKESPTPIDITLSVAEADDQLALTWEYNLDLFAAQTIEQMMGHFHMLLAAVVDDPQQPVATLPLLTDAERHRLLTAWNDTATPEPPTYSLSALFDAQAVRTPHALAVVCEEEQMTYGELFQRANQLAHVLQAQGVQPRTMVGVYLERSVDVVVSLLAIFKAGGVYVPLDPAYPEERLNYILEDSGVAVLLTQCDLVGQLPHWRDASSAERPYTIICLDSSAATLAQERSDSPTCAAQPDDPAYVIYTSGSTGHPKGVLISNRAIARHCYDVCAHYELTPHDSVLQFASLNFDASLEQILPPLISGAKVVLRGPEIWNPSEFHHHVARHNLTVINPPTAYWHLLTQTWAKSPELTPAKPFRLVIVGGDRIKPEVLRLWNKTSASGGRLLNAYGPTETTITATTCDISPQMAADEHLLHVPIGRPLPNRQVYILDASGNPVPRGVCGELHIGGAGLASGYLNRPELMNERFVPNPFSADPEARLYRTGDMVRYLADGTIEFLGRVDQQVKIRGFRVELGEIETVLARHPKVQEAIVLDQEDHAGDKYLVAYVIPRRTQSASGDSATEGTHLTFSSATVAESRDFIRQHLPEYMVPTAFAVLDAWPLTPSGKVDRRALAAVETISVHDATFVPPRNDIEQHLIDIWTSVLNIDQIGIYDNFFDLGGHSLLATQLITRIEERFHIDIPLRLIFETPNAAELAIAIAQLQANQVDEHEMDRLFAEIEQLSDDEVRHLLTI